MIPQRPSPFKARLETSVRYGIQRRIVRAGRALAAVGLAALFTACGLVPNQTTPDLLARSVVALHVKVEHNAWAGSGVVLGLQPSVDFATCKVVLITAAHVVSYLETGNDGVTRPTPSAGVALAGVPALQIIVHQNRDIALATFLFKVPCTSLPYVVTRVGFTEPKPLDEIIHVGFPAHHFIISRGTYVGRFEVNDQDVGATTSVGGPGSSGGGIFASGALIGVLIAGETVNPFRNYYVPIEYYLELVPSLE